MTITELLPCPFCGGKPTRLSGHVDRIGTVAYVECNACCAKTTACTNIDRAAELWNARTETHNERVIRSCNQKISELEVWNRDYREQIAFWKAKAEGSSTSGE